MKSLKCISKSLAVAGLAGLGIWISAMLPMGCDLGKVSGGDTTGTNTPTKHVAKLQITNNKEKNPGKLTFKLWGSLALDGQQSNPVLTIGTVDVGQTKTFEVPSDKAYKLGYIWNLDNTPQPAPVVEMPDAELSGGTWPKIQFADSGLYHLRIFTNNDENRDYWSGDIPIVP